MNYSISFAAHHVGILQVPDIVRSVHNTAVLQTISNIEILRVLNMSYIWKTLESHDPLLAPALEDSDDQSLTSFFKVETVGDAWDSLRMAVPLFLLIVVRAGVVRSESVHLMQQQYQD